MLDYSLKWKFGFILPTFPHFPIRIISIVGLFIMFQKNRHRQNKQHITYFQISPMHIRNKGLIKILLALLPLTEVWYRNECDYVPMLLTTTNCKIDDVACKSIKSRPCQTVSILGLPWVYRQAVLENKCHRLY